jgi:hypothetical protein
LTGGPAPLNPWLKDRWATRPSLVLLTAEAAATEVSKGFKGNDIASGLGGDVNTAALAARDLAGDSEGHFGRQTVGAPNAVGGAGIAGDATPAHAAGDMDCGQAHMVWKKPPPPAPGPEKAFWDSIKRDTGFDVTDDTESRALFEEGAKYVSLAGIAAWNAYIDQAGPPDAATSSLTSRTGGPEKQHRGLVPKCTAGGR